MSRIHARKLIIFLLSSAISAVLTGQISGLNPNSTPTWDQCIDFYRQLDQKHDYASLTTIGNTDSGKPIHLFIINKDKVFYPELFGNDKVVLFVNNAIHAGEPDGVNASMHLCDSLLNGMPGSEKILDHVILCIIPIYNVDGAMNRNSFSRANQNGPAEYGFRGDVRNLDLNRDFIKCDSRNSAVFNRIYQRIKPHVVVDTHVSNGADYPYTMTLISTQYDKLGGTPGKFLKQKMEPALFESMKNSGFLMSPYVHSMGRTPDTGLVSFLETARFSTGYTALFGSIGFVTETHMLKPFDKRVESTVVFFNCLLKYLTDNKAEVLEVVRKGRMEIMNADQISIAYKLDAAYSEQIGFTGYTSKTLPSKVGVGERLFYDTTSSWRKTIPFYNRYISSAALNAPEFYVLPQAWHQVVDRLKNNRILMLSLSADTIMEVECSYILDYKSSKSPVEGHYFHYDVKTENRRMKIQFNRGDYIIPVNQFAKQYLVLTLEPQSEEGFFAWNFFDSVLQQKEWFSDYVFEEKAEALLAADPNLKKEFEAELNSNESMRNNHWEQLYWIYRHSDYYEKSAFRFPVYRSISK